MHKKNIICLMGPSASGKTSFSIKLHKYLNIEIINIDSSMIYKEMNIGTGKPIKNKLKKIRHNLTNILSPSENYSAFKFCLDSFLLINQSFLKKKLHYLLVEI